MKKTILSLALLMSLTATAQQKLWTLEDCIRYAIENNITLKQSQLKKQTATETRKQSQAALLPSLSAATNQSVGYRPWTDQGSITVTNGQVDTKTEKTYYNGNYSVSAQWTVWNGNQNHNQVKLNRVLENQAELSAQATANTIQERIAQLYVQILYQTEAVLVNRQSVETSKKNEERGQQMLEVGKMSKADVAQLTAQRATDEYTLTESQAQLDKYKLQLKQQLELTNEDFDIAIPVTTDEAALREIPPMSTVYEAALLQRPEIKSAELEKSSGDLQLKMAKAQWLPTLSMTGGVSTSTNSLNDNTWGAQMKTNFNSQLGASLSIPIYDQRRARTAVNKALITQQEALLKLQEQQKKLYSDVETYWLDAMTNQQKFRTALLNVASEQASYDLLQEQFQLGLKNIVELMTGKDKLLKAQQNMLQSKYTTILNQQLLKFYQGEKMRIEN
ncbi:MAG: TolC family protein [Prevotella sp.]|nr:TolC family protein [Prevotella sp.]MBR1414709.1 TolC family protein [Prevotella sp.]